MEGVPVRTALLADIHGNLHALRAVMDDVRTAGVDRYMFLGDYCFSLPFPDECAEIVRSTPRSAAVRGNGEDRLERLSAQDRRTWTDAQMSAAYWTVRTMSRETLGIIASLPDTEILTGGGPPVLASHTLRRLTGSGEESLPDGSFRFPADAPEDAAYVFGHTHRQRHTRIGGRVLVNPGSVGNPTDGNPNAAYTVLEHRDGSWRVEEHRVAYDMDAAASAIRASTQYECAPVWCSLILRELRTGRSHAEPFLAWAERYARRIGDPVRPFSQETWEAAYRTWTEAGMDGSGDP